jgi:small GTP-binding protein
MSADGPLEAESIADTPSASVTSAVATSEKKTCKLLLVGPPCAGKSSLLQAYNGADLDAYGVYRPTTSSDFTVKDVRICDIDICLQVWDVGGNSMGRSFLRGSNAVVLVVDLTNLSSMDGLDALYERVRNFSGFPDDNFPCILLGNKSDLATGNKREITFDMLLKWAQERRQEIGNKIHCFEASAKTKSGVLEAFTKACEIFVRKPVSPGAPSFVPTTSSVVDGAESATSGRRRGIPNRSFMNSSGGSMEDEDIPIAKIVLAGKLGFILHTLCCYQHFSIITYTVSDHEL